MKRRAFLESSVLTALAVSTSGFISFDGKNYVGDCETTSDILGPFYRPNSPVRRNLVVKGDKGQMVELIGKVKHQDCITPYKNAKIELWHCDSKGVYDNSTSEFKYRGVTFSDQNGHYSFNTILPVAYDAGGGQIRPAHFHLLISADGYQPLVTQLYFNGDKHIEEDIYANAEAAKRRILDVKDTKNGKKVIYEVSMAKIMQAEPASLDKLLGRYINEKDKTKTIEFFKHNASLWSKNEVFGNEYKYIGHNTFEYPGLPKGNSRTLTFEILGSGTIKCSMNSEFNGKKTSYVFLKA